MPVLEQTFDLGLCPRPHCTSSVLLTKEDSAHCRPSPGTHCRVEAAPWRMSAAVGKFRPCLQCCEWDRVQDLAWSWFAEVRLSALVVVGPHVCDVFHSASCFMGCQWQEGIRGITSPCSWGLCGLACCLPHLTSSPFPLQPRWPPCDSGMLLPQGLCIALLCLMCSCFFFVFVF